MRSILFILLFFSLFCYLYEKASPYQKQNGDCQDLYLNFCHSSYMLKESLIAINKRIAHIKRDQQVFQASEDLYQFYLLVSNLHQKIRDYLRVECLSPENTEASEFDSQQSVTKSANLPMGCTVENQQDFMEQSKVQTEPKSMNLKQSFKSPGQKKIRVAKALSLNKNYKELMENVNLIILYQNKIEQILELINNSEKMTQICLNQNLYDINNLNRGNKVIQDDGFHFDYLKDNIQKVIVECKEIKDIHDNFKQLDSKQSVKSVNSKSSNTSKKSLLTEMLRMADEVQIQNEQISTPKKNTKKPQSQRNFSMRANKMLMKEIDFTGYKIQQLDGRKQKKARKQNKQVCSKCTIF